MPNHRSEKLRHATLAINDAISFEDAAEDYKGGTPSESRGQDDIDKLFASDRAARYDAAKGRAKDAMAYMAEAYPVEFKAVASEMASAETPVTPPPAPEPTPVNPAQPA